MVYRYGLYSVSDPRYGTLEGFLEHSLASFNTTEIESQPDDTSQNVEICRYESSLSVHCHLETRKNCANCYILCFIFTDTKLIDIIMTLTSLFGTKRRNFIGKCGWLDLLLSLFLRYEFFIPMNYLYKHFKNVHIHNAKLIIAECCCCLCDDA